MITDIARRVGVLSCSAFEVAHLLMQLGSFRFKLRVLGLKLNCLRFKFSYLLFKRRILVRRQRKTLTKYCSGAVLGDESFDVLEDSHLTSPSEK